MPEEVAEKTKEKVTKKRKKVKLKFNGSHFTFDDASGHREVRNGQVFEIDESVLRRPSFRFMIEKKALVNVK